MEIVATVEAILKQSPGDGLCAACLALACEVSLLEMRQIVERLVGSAGSFDVDPTCARCRRTVTTVVYRRPLATEERAPSRRSRDPIGDSRLRVRDRDGRPPLDAAM
jgi:hypothetical protein